MMMIFLFYSAERQNHNNRDNSSNETIRIIYALQHMDGTHLLKFLICTNTILKKKTSYIMNCTAKYRDRSYIMLRKHFFSYEIKFIFLFLCMRECVKIIFSLRYSFSQLFFKFSSSDNIKLPKYGNSFNSRLYSVQGQF